MNLPDKIFAQISCEGGSNLSDIIIELKIKAGRKNSYHILFPKTDPNGTAILVRENFIGQFNDHFESGLMDYDGTIETANSTIEVSLFNPAWLIENKNLAMAWPLLKNEKLKWRTKDEQYKYLTICRNNKFDFDPIKFNLDESNQIVMLIISK